MLSQQSRYHLLLLLVLPILGVSSESSSTSTSSTSSGTFLRPSSSSYPSDCPDSSNDGTPSSSFKIVGTRAVQTLTKAWKEEYLKTTTSSGGTATASTKSSNPKCDRTNTNQRPSSMVDIQVEGYGMGSGSARVCGIHPIYDDADIAGMSSPFYSPQASTTDGWSFHCKFNSQRKTTLLKVAHEGIALIASTNGAVATCIHNHLGGSLSLDQLRWMFSSYSMDQLDHQRGLNLEESVPFEDGNDATHLWSELHSNCSATEIHVVYVQQEIGAQDFLMEHVLYGPGESLRQQHLRQEEGDDGGVESVVQYLQDHPNNAISFLQLGDLHHSPILQEQADDLLQVPIRRSSNGNGAFDDNDDAMMKAYPPEAEAFENELYPLSRPMYLGVWNDPQALKVTAPFLQFGFSSRGTEILQEVGFWSIDEWEKIVMRTRLQLLGTDTKEGSGSDVSVPLFDIQRYCGRDNGSITMAGSATVFPIARIWSEIYKLGCPTIDISTIDQGGSSAGAGRVCRNWKKGSPVDIGNMSREWKTKEGLARNGKLSHVYDCQKPGDTSRSAIQVDIAKDGLTVIVKKGGIADQCQQILGGFTIDQLRWIYSKYTESELEATGTWDPTSLSNSDNDPTTHLWSELDSRCAAQEIRLAGDILGEGTHTNFRKTVMKDLEGDGQEDIDVNRPLGYFQALGFELVAFLQSHGDAISYIGFNYYFDNKELLAVAPIQNMEGMYITPSAATIGDGSYNPLVRSISMNLWNDKQSLKDTVPLLWFGYAHPELVTATGMVPIQGKKLQEMRTRLVKAREGDVPRLSSSSATSAFYSKKNILWSQQMVLVILGGIVTLFSSGVWW